MSTATGVSLSRRLLDNVPRELQRRHQWIVWKYEKREGKWTKVPYGPRTKKRASSTDYRTWATFPEVLEILEGGKVDGIGFVFSADDPYCGIDLDDCSQDGVIEPWAREVMQRFQGYAEFSPSRTGIHIIVRGELERGRKNDEVEVYSQARFFTVTGEVLNA